MLTIGNQSESDADAPEGVSAFLALGGNLGDREAVFRDALRRLRENGFAVWSGTGFLPRNFSRSRIRALMNGCL